MKLRIVFALLLLMATIPLDCGTKYPSDEEVAEIEKVLRAGTNDQVVLPPHIIVR